MFPYKPAGDTVDYEILEILKELCPDFAPYNYLKEYDLYKGSLFGGTNIYFKNGVNGTKGMIASKTNIKLYGLDKYPYNFQTGSSYNKEPEFGWSGEVLLSLLKDLREQKETIKNKTKVLCLATGQTYELVLQTGITAHPLEAPYPKKQPEYVGPIKKGGTIEFLFKVVTVIDCLPKDIYKYQDVLSKQQYLNLVKYHEYRQNTFGYGKVDFAYRFYVLEMSAHIIQPFERKNIQVSTWVEYGKFPKIDVIDKDNDCDDGFATNTVNEQDIHEGHLTQLMVNKYERNPIARKKCIEYHGFDCMICGMNFGDRYGDLGKGFIHVHHLKPLHTIGKDYVVDYKKDLIPVCPNCHAMIHKIDNASNMTLEEIKNILKC